MNNTLESHKLFPYIAWTLVVGFALFTYSLTLHLNESFDDIDTSVQNLEDRVEALEQRI